MKPFKTKTRVLSLGAFKKETNCYGAILATCKLHAIRLERQRVESIIGECSVPAVILNIDVQPITT